MRRQFCVFFLRNISFVFCCIVLFIFIFHFKLSHYSGMWFISWRGANQITLRGKRYLSFQCAYHTHLRFRGRVTHPTKIKLRNYSDKDLVPQKNWNTSPKVTHTHTQISFVLSHHICICSHHCAISLITQYSYVFHTGKSKTYLLPTSNILNFSASRTKWLEEEKSEKRTNQQQQHPKQKHKLSKSLNVKPSFCCFITTNLISLVYSGCGPKCSMYQRVVLAPLNGNKYPKISFPSTSHAFKIRPNAFSTLLRTTVKLIKFSTFGSFNQVQNSNPNFATKK